MQTYHIFYINRKLSIFFISGKYDIISDASPSVGQVSKGTRVCLRTSVELNEDVDQPGMFLYNYKTLLAYLKFSILET